MLKVANNILGAVNTRSVSQFRILLILGFLYPNVITDIRCL